MKGMRNTIIAIAFASGTALFAQNYPPPNQGNYPQQNQGNYPQQNQGNYPQQNQNNYPPPPPYYGQQPNYDQQQPPQYAQQQMNPLVGRIALYPDPLLAQVLTASTFSNQIPDATGWARAHNYLNGDQLAHAIQDDRLPWDPSVLALLPFPTVLDMMSGDMGWTQQLGNAVLSNRAGVMDAVQQERATAMNYGYLRTNEQERVVSNAPNDIEIYPVDPAVVYVPYYDPYIVYARPRPGFFIGGAISFGPRIGIGAFAPWGWGGVSFGWREHNIIVNNRPWVRTWTNRTEYVHPYAAPRFNAQPNQVIRQEHHELREYRAPEVHENRGGERGGERKR